MAKIILIADDDKGILTTMQTILSGRGYTVHVAHNGDQAVEAAIKHHPDLIIMDVQMPKMDGDQAAMLIKEEESLKGVPIIFCTGLRTDKEIAEDHEDNIFAKPVHLDQLLAKIKQILGE